MSLPVHFIVKAQVAYTNHSGLKSQGGTQGHQGRAELNPGLWLVGFYIVAPCFKSSFIFPSRTQFEHRAGSHPCTTDGWLVLVGRGGAGHHAGTPWGIKQMVLPTERPLSSGQAKGPSRDLHRWPSPSTFPSASGHQPLVQTMTGQVSQQLCCLQHHYLPGQRRRLCEAQRSLGCRVIGPFRSKLSAAGNKTLPFNSGIIRSGLETSQGKAFIEKWWGNEI